MSNNFGALRLFFAFLVIFSHSPELIDGNRSREILTTIFKTISFGELAVDCFFLISGYLIFKSYQNSSSFFEYLKKRILRIYPGFIVASIISLVVFAPLSAGLDELDWSLSQAIKNIVKLFFLSTPSSDGAFKNNHYPILNGAMWTIRFEFICYLLTPIFAFVLIRSRYAFLILILIFTNTYLIMKLGGWDYEIDTPFYFRMIDLVRFITAFMVGAAYSVYSENIIWNKYISLLCAALFIVLMMFSVTAELGLMIFGGYLLFNFALNYKHAYLNKIGSKNDISYGVYLYAWPFQNLIIQNVHINPWLLAIITIIYTCVVGYLSWVIVEKPFIKLKKSFSRPSRLVAR